MGALSGGGKLLVTPWVRAIEESYVVTCIEARFPGGICDLKVQA
jgi:hypothetical protein